MATTPPERVAGPLASGQDDRFRLATHAAGLGIMELRLPERDVDLDARAHELLGVRSPGTTLDWSRWLARVHETDRAVVATMFEASLARREAIDVTFQVDDETRRFLRAQGSGAPGAEAAPSLIVCLTDVTTPTIAQQALRESEERFRGAFHDSAMGMALVSPSGEWLQVNKAVCDFVGYDAEELKRITFQDITHPDDIAPDLALVADVLEGRRTHYHLEKRYFHKSGALVWGLLSVSLVRDERGAPLQFVSSIQDITERKLAQAALEASLAEKETLIQEIHHRVKNNMQVISSILRLQSRYIADATHRAMFDECRDRIHTMALVHEKLYRTANLATLNFGTHLRELAQLSRFTQKMPEERVEVIFDVDDVDVTAELAIPLGLVANELVSNAFKHAFVDRPGGQLFVSLKRKASRLSLSIADDGRGLPPTFDTDATSTLGLRLIRTLVAQIHGSLTVESGMGTRIRVECDLEEA